MKRPGPPRGDLLNLPLDDLGEPPKSSPPLGVQDLLPFDSDEHEALVADEVVPQSGDPKDVDFGSRLKASLLDLGSVAAATLLAAIGSWTLGAEMDLASVPAFLLFAVSFSFLYTIFPLTFWSQTPGMTVMGLTARARNDAPLTIQQSIRRWLGGIITVIMLGLPLLLALVGPSLADRMSHSRVSFA